MNLVKIFKAGQNYMAICPKDKALSYSYPEIKIINHIKSAKKVLPPIIIALILWQYYLPAQLVVTIITILFALSLPIQGILWLGYRSQSPLPLNLVDSYNRIKLKLIEKKVLSPNKNPNEKLTFESLIKLINLSKIHLGNYFGEDDDTSNQR
jgi:uncharacterized protein